MNKNLDFHHVHIYFFFIFLFEIFKNQKFLLLRKLYNTHFIVELFILCLIKSKIMFFPAYIDLR